MRRGSPGREDRHRDRREPGHRRGDRAAVRRGGGRRRGGRPDHASRASPRCRARSATRRRRSPARAGPRWRSPPTSPGPRIASAWSTETARQLGPPDILVSNAAVSYFTPVADFSPRRYALMFAVQVEAPFELARLVLPGMRDRGRGWILNISSVAARHPSVPPGRFAIGSTVYGMCKAALERFSTGLAAELYAGQHRGQRAGPDPGGAHARHDLPPPDHRGRPERRAARGDGRGRADALPRATRRP